MQTLTNSILGALLLGAIACTGNVSTEVEVVDPGGGDTSGGEDNTFDHPGQVDVWALLDRIAEEGPPRYSSRLHSCPKMRYETIGRVLTSLGVDLTAAGALTAGKGWRDGESALGAPVYPARQRENLELTTASASRLFDIFASAAPEIIASSASAPGCGVAIFDTGGACNKDGLTCLLGQPATDGHVALCDEIVARATTPEKGEVIAVAAIAAAGHTCE